ncbi:MAG TPA: hypothetical protein PLN91_00755 [Rhodanobacteraceae bacterium]|nr:hypothetical protein [Rhodanobacteraceae bacterium]
MEKSIYLENPAGKKGPKVWKATFDTIAHQITIQFGSKSDRKPKLIVIPNATEVVFNDRVNAKLREGYVPKQDPSTTPQSSPLFLARLRVTDSAIARALHEDLDAVSARLGFVATSTTTRVCKLTRDWITVDTSTGLVEAEIRGAFNTRMAGFAAAVAERYGLRLVDMQDERVIPLEILVQQSAEDRANLDALGYPVPVDMPSIPELSSSLGFELAW